MSKHKTLWLTMTLTLAVSLCPAVGQNGVTGGLYRIVSGTYDQCCGIGGDFQNALPNEGQGYIRLTVDSQNLVTMAFLSQDLQTVFSIIPCPLGSPVEFDFRYGFVHSGTVFFHVDPGPLGLWWNYSVTNSPNRLRLDGTLGFALLNCVDAFTHFSHSNVVATLVSQPKIRITEFSKEQGPLLFIQGTALWTNVVEASTDLVSWTPISTNLMPATLCPICPYILVRDPASTNLDQRFYRSFEFP